MKLNHFVLSIIVLSLLIFFGCADVPQQDIDDAQSALQAAKQAEADRYVPDMYNSAKKELDDALAMVEEEKSAWFSNYDDAVNLLQSARSKADAAKNAVAAKKEELRQQTAALLQQIPDAISEAETLWKRAPRGKGTREPLQMIQNDIESAKALAHTNTIMPSKDLDIDAYANMFASKATSVVAPKADKGKSTTSTTKATTPPQTATKTTKTPQKRGRKGDKIATAFLNVPSAPVDVNSFAKQYNVSLAVLRQSKRFDKSGIEGAVRVKKDKDSGNLVIWREPK